MTTLDNEGQPGKVEQSGVREDQIQNAVGFLTHPKVGARSISHEGFR